MVVPKPEFAKSRYQSLTGGLFLSERTFGARSPEAVEAPARACGTFGATSPQDPGQDSRMATTPWPPAAQMEIRPRLPGPASCSCFAREATIRPPVAAKGWPAASDEPLTLSLDRSMAPKGASRPSRSLQNAESSQAFSVASTVEANASWIS